MVMLSNLIIERVKRAGLVNLTQTRPYFNTQPDPDLTLLFPETRLCNLCRFWQNRLDRMGWGKVE